MNAPVHTSFSTLLKKLRQGFQSQKTRPLEWRLEQLQNMSRLLLENETDLYHALFLDLGKHKFEAYVSEIGILQGEIRYTQKHLAQWLKPKTVATPLVHRPAKSFVMREPLGLVLIVGPWNYPVQLVFSPLIGAIAAGNCAIVKPSEISHHTSTLVAKLIPQYLDTDCISIVTGGVETAEHLLKEKFDHIFFTGNPMVGRMVMQAAAQHLTPVTLELGGKSPCIIDEDADLALAAKRVAWGKFFNAGQTCIAPDYVLVHHRIQKDFLAQIRNAVFSLYGKTPKTNDSFGRIVSEKHVHRLSTLLEGAEIFLGGDFDIEKRYFAPTILTNINSHAKVMQEEIFGPILPVMSMKNLEDGIEFINSREKPLALYFFSNNRQHKKQILNCTSAGGVCINDTISHAAVPELPFGGVGNSGMGSYHGEMSFNTFSHHKGVFVKSNVIDVPLRYPPYNEGKRDLVRWFL